MVEREAQGGGLGRGIGDLLAGGGQVAGPVPCTRTDGGVHLRDVRVSALRTWNARVESRINSRLMSMRFSCADPIQCRYSTNGLNA